MSNQRNKILSALKKGKRLTVRDMLLDPFNSNCPPRRIADLKEIDKVKIQTETLTNNGKRFSVYYLAKSEINRLRREENVRKNK